MRLAMGDRLALAIDGELVGSDAILHDGAEVALLPPVSGGRPGRAQIAEAPIDLAALMKEASPPDCGATVLFVGTVRNISTPQGASSPLPRSPAPW